MNEPTDASATLVLQRLVGQIDSLAPKLRDAARFIVDHPAEIGVSSMRRLAQLSGVTPNTLTRLARTLGFNGYESLRDVFRDAIRDGAKSIPDRAKWLQSIGRGGRHAGLVGEMARAMLQNLEHMYSAIDLPTLERAARAIISAHQVFVLGVRGVYGLAHNFYYVGRMALPNLVLVPRQGSTALDDMIAATSRDVVLAITLAPYARETIAACMHARQRGAHLVAVTDSRASPLAGKASHELIAPSATPQFFNSTAATAALLETLLAMIVALGDRRMLGSIGLYDSVRTKHRVYWDGGPAK